MLPRCPAPSFLQLEGFRAYAVNFLHENASCVDGVADYGFSLSLSLALSLSLYIYMYVKIIYFFEMLFLRPRQRSWEGITSRGFSRSVSLYGTRKGTPMPSLRVHVPK